MNMIKRMRTHTHTHIDRNKRETRNYMERIIKDENSNPSQSNPNRFILNIR